MKKILILNGSFCEKPIIEKAKEMGYYVLTTGNDPELIGHQSADEYIPCDYSDKEAILELVKDNGIEGIVSCANDFGVLTASYVAEQMGWKGHDTYEHALMMHHKDKFKQYCFEHDIPSPHSHIFTDVESALEYSKACEYPVIVKANDLTGGKGIKRADTPVEAEEAVRNAFDWSRDKHILIEPYITGTQHSICVFLINKKVAVSSSCKCYSFTNPYLIQAETFPSCEMTDEIQRELENIIEKMAIDLGLADGILNLQFILKDHKPYIIEMMRRCFGNEALLPYTLVTGFDWNEAYIKAALGLNCSTVKKGKPLKKYCGHYGVMPYRNGILKEYKIDSDIDRHIFKKTEMIQVGEEITNCLNERIVYLYYEYNTSEEMNREVTRFSEGIHMKIE
ncbi:MAG: ATP-grasp domain-containing protein [Dorea sp.]|nr:ATP-grasp domain-containing protein [Dorea sp.]